MVFGNNTKDMSNVKFRGVEFGAEPEEVEKSEDSEVKREIQGNIETLNVEDNLKSHRFLVGYHFVNEKLAQGTYICTEEFIDEKECASLYHSLYDMLEEKYGKPTKKNEVNDVNEIYSTGVYGASIWEGDNKGVELHLQLQKNTMMLRIMYVDKELNEKLLQAQDNQTSKKL